MSAIPKVKDQQSLWPGTTFAWQILVVGFGAMVGLFALSAFIFSGIRAVRLFEHSSPLAKSWILTTALVVMPGAFAAVTFFRMKKLTSKASNHRETMIVLGRDLLLLLFFCYFLVDLLLIKLASVIG